MTVTSYREVVVLGMGTWGFGLSCVLAENHGEVRVWDRTLDQLREDLKRRRHHKLDEVEAPSNLRLLEERDAEHIAPDALIVLAVPSFAIREVCEDLRGAGVGTREETMVIAAKGIELPTKMLMPEVVVDVLGGDAVRRTALLSGPSHAEEVVKRQPTTVVAAAEDPTLAKRIQHAFLTRAFRVYSQTDVKGVALGSSLKNIYAIAAGAADGLGFGDNTQAALMTRGLAEICRLGKRMKADPDTFAGLAGLGDLIVTCMSRHSRNRRFGRLRAEGRTTEEAETEIGMVVEGVRTTAAAIELAREYEVEMPIVEEVHALIYENKPPRDAVRDLMRRDPKPEDTLAR